MKVKKRIKLARRGHKLLKMKRDGLVMEFFKLVSELKKTDYELLENYKKAREALAIARSIEGNITIKAVADELKHQPLVETETKNIMGVRVPTIKAESFTKHMHERGYGLIEGSSKIDEAAFAYEKLLENIVAAVELEISVKRLLTEIEKTKRRVNALEFKTIPSTEKEQAFISFRLEELERESTFRLKRFKKMSA